MFLSIGRILLIGVIATLTMDILGAILRRAHWVMSLPPALIGRWVAPSPEVGPFRQTSSMQRLFITKLSLLC